MIEITESAKNKVVDLLMEENNPNLMLRTFVQGGGCSGFSNGFTFDEIKSWALYILNLPLKEGGFSLD